MDSLKVVVALIIAFALFLAFHNSFNGITGNYVGLNVQFNSIVGCDSKIMPKKIPIKATGNREIGEVSSVNDAIVKCNGAPISVCYLRNGTLYEGQPKPGDFVIVKIDTKRLASDYGFNEYYVCIKSNLEGGKELGKKLLSLSQDNMICSVKLKNGNYYGVINGNYGGGEIGEVYIFEDPC